jgi:hypothetical protein
MDVVSTGINALVVGLIGLVLGWLGKGRFDTIERRIDRMDDRLDGRMDSFQVSLDGMRSDLTQVALAVGAKPRASNR